MPASPNDADVVGLAAFWNSTDPGPLTSLHVLVTTAPSGSPSSATDPSGGRSTASTTLAGAAIGFEYGGLAGAAIGAIAGGVGYAVYRASTGQNVDLGGVLISAGVGAIAGAVIGSGVGLVACIGVAEAAVVRLTVSFRMR